MLGLRFDCSGVFVVVGLGVLSLQGSVCAQIAAHQEFDRGYGVVRGDGLSDEVTTPDFAGTVIVGRVIGPDGAPAVGAVVVTSAGGQAVTDAEGAYSLEVEVPVDAASVRVTAVLGSGTGSQVGSASVGGLTAWGMTPAGTLVLEQAGTCQPSWLPTFGGYSGTNDQIQALAAFDDGSGPALFAGGRFTTAGGVATNSIAKWDGSSWSALGSGLGGMYPYVYALTAYDDGSGQALYAGGWFTTAGGVPANYIAKWNGTSWSALGSGVNGTVEALTALDDGSGPALYAGGYFTTAGGVAANYIAKWSGSSWSALGSGMSGTGGMGGTGPHVDALSVFDDGSGTALYAGGSFTTAGGVTAKSIAKWNGTTWSKLGSGIGAFGEGARVGALTVFDDGSGPALYAGGNFTAAGGVPAKRIAKWNGASWSALGSGMDSDVEVLTVFDDGSGPALYAGGLFSTAGGFAAKNIAKWNGTSWSALGSGVEGSVQALTVFDDGSGPVIHASVGFLPSGGGMTFDIAKWNGTSWSPLGSGISSSVSALTVFDDGSGPALFAGASVITAGGVWANSIAKWNGHVWSALGSGMSASVDALTVFDDGSGPALYAGGYFTTAGGVPANSIAKWNGANWSALGSGMSASFGGVSVVRALTVFDDGSGPALYAGGSFSTAGGVAAKFIAKWDGTSWSAVGSGMDEAVWDFAVFDAGTGSGPELYAGGDFLTAGGVTTNHIAKWDGSGWSPLGSGLDDWFDCAIVFDDGSGGGPALFAGGNFMTAGGVAANRIAKWNGISWSALGSGMDNSVVSLTVFDDGSGPAAYAGGPFATAGGVSANRIAKWNGTSWSALGSGMGGGPFSSVYALTVFDDGSGPALYAGGDFTTSPAGDSYLAKWGGCSPPPSPWTKLGSGLAGISGIPQLNGTGELLAGTPGKLRLIDAAPSAPAALFISASNTPTPFKGGILLTVPVLLTLPLVTDSMGDLLLPWTAWPSGLSGVSLYFQYAIQDSAALKGVALSNALGADVP